MICLEIRFTGQGYHATPWGRHVNEGAVEWPPCPWRLLRALLAVGFSTEGWVEGSLPAEASELFRVLASQVPVYHLPAGIETHSRHYMPMARFKDGREETTLVLDSWLDIGTRSLLVAWAIELSAGARALLERLAARMPYLGRAESWARARLVDREAEWNCVPVQSDEDRARPWERLQVLAPKTENDYLQWRENELVRALEGVEKKGQRKKIEQLYPVDGLNCLLQDNAIWQRQGWNRPPGSEYRSYWFKPYVPVLPRVERARGGSAKTTQAVLLAMSLPSGNRNALPSVTRTLPIAEAIHHGLAYWADRSGVSTRNLTGREAHATASTRQHAHLHVIPLDLDNDARLDHVLLWAAEGISSAEVRVIQRLRRTWSKGIAEDISLRVAWQGNLEDAPSLPDPWGSSLVTLSGTGRNWSSSTPLVLARYPKRKTSEAFQTVIRQELRWRGYPDPVSIELLPQDGSQERLRWRHYVRRRRDRKAPPIDSAFGVRICFAEEVTGPIALGYGSHFGLGLLKRDSSQKEEGER